jgi:hypothetical protein
MPWLGVTKVWLMASVPSNLASLRTAFEMFRGGEGGG